MLGNHDIGAMGASEYISARERLFAGELSVTTGLDEHGSYYMTELGRIIHLGFLTEIPEPLRELRLEDLRPRIIAN